MKPRKRRREKSLIKMHKTPFISKKNSPPKTGKETI